MVIIFSKITCLVITVKFWTDVRQNGFFCLIYCCTTFDLKKKVYTINIVKIKLIKISPGNSDENVPNKMFEVSVLFSKKVVNIFIFHEEENTRSVVCKIFQEINTVKIE